MINCTICSKEFINKNQLIGHMRIHGNSNGKCFNLRCCCIYTKKEIAVKNLNKFQQSLKKCSYCYNYLDSNRKFCNRKCSAKITNLKKIKSKESMR